MPGDDLLRSKIKELLHSRGLDMSLLDVMITVGANQAFSNTATALCDNGGSAGFS